MKFVKSRKLHRKNVINPLIMSNFQIYEINLIKNTYIMIHPIYNYALEKGRYDEAVKKHFEADGIETNIDVVDNLSINSIKKSLITTDIKEMRYKKKINGIETWCLTTLIVLKRKNGIPSKVILTIKNIESIVQDEINTKTILRAKAIEAKKASDAKTRFLSQMSHEIRTPLNSIIGFNELAIKNNTDRVIAQYLDNIQSSSKHLLDLINEVLDMSRIESGKLTLDNKVVNLNVIVDHVFDILQNGISKKNIKVTKSIDIIHEYIYTDKVRISQMLLNILNNSIKFVLDNGEICFSLKEVKYTSDKTYYQIIVTDNGIGMSDSFLERAFIPFERDESNIFIEGTGLGLPIVKSIVEMMNGSINLESKEGEGTKVEITLCFDVYENCVGTDSKDFHNKDIRGKNILVVEDNELNQELVKIILTENEINCTMAENGSVAVEKIKNNNYDLVLMDCLMPIMDGYEATRKIREINKSIPIIAMTANAFTEDISKSISAGMNAHISKPLSLTSLITILKKYL